MREPCRMMSQAGSTCGRTSSDDGGLAVDGLQGGGDEREALDESSAHTFSFLDQHTDTSDALLIGQWSPHSETVVSIQAWSLHTLAFPTS